jgi:hypothetical protein
MKTALQLLTGAQPELAKKFTQQSDADWKTEVVDLTRKDIDYHKALEKIFEADSIQVW